MVGVVPNLNPSHLGVLIFFSWNLLARMFMTRRNSMPSNLMKIQRCHFCPNGSGSTRWDFVTIPNMTKDTGALALHSLCELMFSWMLKVTVGHWPRVVWVRTIFGSILARLYVNGPNAGVIATIHKRLLMSESGHI